MSLKPWYKVVTPREDLRDGKPLDAAEFAVHLDKVREGTAPKVYSDPEQFFERTYLTQNLKSVSAEVIRRLSGEKTETSAVFNLSTQFGGGKTHTLTLLYHLAKHGPDSMRWSGVKGLVEKAGVKSVPKAAIAVFVGTEFDSITGRGGDDGTPVRYTPWGEIAFQLGGAKALKIVAEHEKSKTAPAGDVIRKFLPKDSPCLILMDELMNYVSRNRKSGLSSQLYDFLQSLSETVRGMDKAALIVAIPKSDQIEMTTDDESDFNRLKHMLNRLGKAIIPSSEGESSEIIRRRLFEWTGLPDEGRKVASEYNDWILDHRQEIPNWFPVDSAQDAFASSYPFHPLALSVFERKWQALPRFQRTRGMLRLLALWVSRAYQEGFKGAHRDAVIGLGSAPLDDPMFRAALFEQLGESRLEAAVTTDICGKKNSHAVRLDKEAVDAIKKARLHQKAAAAIFFESNGGQAKGEATLPEIRLAVGEPDLELGHLDPVLEDLASNCYYLTVIKNKYRFGMSPNLNKLLADRRANIQSEKIDERVRIETQKLFAVGQGVERVYFPKKSGEIPDRPALSLVVMPVEQSMQEKDTKKQVEAMTKESGTSARTFKSGLVWCVPEAAEPLKDEARALLAWEDIQDEEEDLKLDEAQKRHLSENLKRAQRDLKEAIWRAYKNLMLLDKTNEIKVVDLGLVHSSSADNLVTMILNRLRQDGDLEKGVSPNFLVRYWPPAFTEWSTKDVRDAFFASPIFPKILDPEAIKETIARGVSQGTLAYVGKTDDEKYDPFYFCSNLAIGEIEISSDMFIISKATAEAYQAGKTKPVPETGIGQPVAPSIPEPGGVYKPDLLGSTAHVDPKLVSPKIRKIIWSGDVPWQKWSNFYTKVLGKYAAKSGITMKLNVTATLEGDLPQSSIQETQTSLKELGLSDHLQTDNEE